MEKVNEIPALTRTINSMGDFVIDGKLSVKELYELAKRDGLEDRTIFFSIKTHKSIDNSTTHNSTHTVKSFGKGWTKNTIIMNLEVDDHTKFGDQAPDKN